MAGTVIIWTYEWVPAGPRGHVRDIRLRWACEEAGLDYEVRSTPFRERGDEHLARQPFGQVPFMQDGEITLFESGACLLHLARKSQALMPRDARGEAEVLEWTVAALNSVELVSVPWWYIGLSGEPDNPLEGWLRQRLSRLEAVLARRDWLAAGRFTVADLLMADVLRVPKVRAIEGFPALHAYVDRICARPAFHRAYAGQMAHFARGDGAGAAP